CPINTIAEAFAEPQASARGAIVEHPHPLAQDGVARTIGNPIKYSATPVDYRRRPPMRGEHTQEILAEKLGMDEAQISALAASGIVDLGDPIPKAQAAQ
ncbi:MAG: CoA transferase, partial [Pseudomonadota bacterium]